MTPETNKEIARRWFDEGWSKGNLAIVDAIFDPDFVLSGKRVGPIGPRQNVGAMHRAFTNVRVVIVGQVAEGDVVVTHYRAYGVHRGGFAGVASSGQEIDVMGIVIWRIRAGKVIEDWTVFDQMALLHQIGAFPTSR